MKITKSLLLAAAFVAAAGKVNAQTATVIDITGSTAGRSAVHNAIRTVLSNETFVYNGNNFNGASKVLFKGDISGTPVIIRTSWSGSAAGVRDVAQNNSSVWFANTSIDTNTLNNTNVNLANNTANTVQNTPEIAYSDVFQSSTIYGTPTLTDDTAGIIPFKFYASADAPASLTNITSLQARNLFGAGFIPLAVLSGNASDQSSYVYATGRDPESGTRITGMAEIGYGVFGNVQHYQPTISSGAVTAVTLWPAGTYVEGNGGYTSGSSVKTAVDANGFGNGRGLISFTGPSDWSTVAKELTYNGVAYSVDNVKQGKYTFWGYLHQMKHSSLSGTSNTFYGLLLTAVRADTSWLVKTNEMSVARSSDGGLINPTY
jgi:hypothetical protein